MDNPERAREPIDGLYEVLDEFPRAFADGSMDADEEIRYMREHYGSKGEIK